MGNFAHVQSYVLKAEATTEIPDKEVVAAKLKCATGLEQLEGGRYKRAAKCFLEVSFQLGNGYNEVSILGPRWSCSCSFAWLAAGHQCQRYRHVRRPLCTSLV